MYLQTLTPESVGANDAWDLGAGGDRVTAVLADDGDTSYMRSQLGSPNRQGYFFTDIHPQTSSILAVNIITAMKSEGGPDDGQVYAKIASDYTDVVAVSYGGGYSTETANDVDHPGGGGPTAWLTGNLRGGGKAEFGVLDPDGAGDKLHCTFLSVQAETLLSASGGGGGMDVAGLVPILIPIFGGLVGAATHLSLPAVLAFFGARLSRPGRQVLVGWDEAGRILAAFARFPGRRAYSC